MKSQDKLSTVAQLLFVRLHLFGLQSYSEYPKGLSYQSSKSLAISVWMLAISEILYKGFCGFTQPSVACGLITNRMQAS